VHEFTAYADQAIGGLRRAERLARTEVTLPLYPHLTHADQDHVVQALEENVRALRD
jgi:dTDP-4-amino-4,6-dideoxygalactose transaminase